MVAGRRPRQPADEIAGVTPLHGDRPRRKAAAKKKPGKPSGIGPDGTWTPAYEGQRPPFEAGNTVNTDHGTRAHGTRGDGESRYSPTVLEAADEIMTALLEDPRIPDHVRSPAFRLQLRNMAVAQGVTRVLVEWAGPMNAEELMEPRGRTGQGKSAAELLLSAVAKAAGLNSRMGLDPPSYARLRRDLGLEQRAEEDRLMQLSATGAAIVTRRAEIEGTVISDGDGEPPAT